ncbi:MAG: hypothetical protein JSW46_17075 [Gemmatimonadota bacterium]|nr:MAG: hypothetical protein JSW46_17075 [Gemmatimonadota bacterium]
MNGRNRPGAAEIYQTDLERHLFAPASRRNGQLSSWLTLDPIAGWLRDWLASSRSRWKALAEAWNLS